MSQHIKTHHITSKHITALAQTVSTLRKRKRSLEVTNFWYGADSWCRAFTIGALSIIGVLTTGSVSVAQPDAVNPVLSQPDLSQSNPIKPTLIPEKALKFNLTETSNQASVAYMRPMQCPGVNKVAMQILAIKDGKTQTIWDGTHQRPEGLQQNGATCLFVLLLEPGTRKEDANPTVSFRFGNYEGIRSGKQRRVALADVVTPESWATKEALGSSIPAETPTLLYTRAVGNKADIEPTYDAFFRTESIPDVVEVSKQHTKVTFLAVTLAWSPMP